MHSTKKSVRGVMAGLVLAGMLSLPALAMEPPKDSELLRDFVHYVRIDRPDLAKNYGEGLLKRLPAPIGTGTGEGLLKLTDFVVLVEQSGELARFEETTARAQRLGDLESTASRLLKAYEQGKLEQARDPSEITKNIAMLTGTQRQRLFARERLSFAGEYAMPQLLPALLKRTEPALSAEARQLMADMGRQSIMPLIAALPKVDPSSQEQIVGVLADIPYRTSVPFLYDLRANTKSPPVTAACDRAIKKLDGAVRDGLNISEMFVELGEAYEANAESLISFPRESQQLLWNYDPASGLHATPIITPLFTKASAMRMAERALQTNASNQDGLALWIAANFERELATPAGYVNPAYGAERRDAMYYAVAAGPGPIKMVLARGLEKKSTALVRKAIAAFSQTAGADGLSQGDVAAGRNPIQDALRYPNRRVQYEAALAIAIAQPRTTFGGSDMVVPILASAIRDASAKFALVVAQNPEQQQSLAGLLKGMGYTVLAPASSLSQTEGAVTEAPGVDLIVTHLPAAQTEDLISQARTNSRLAAAPVLAVMSQQGVFELEPRLGRSETVRLMREGTDPQQQAEAIKQLVDRATGGTISADEAADYQTRALAALRDLSISGSAVFNVNDAAGPLMTALGTAKGPIRFQIAEVLSRIGDRKAQAMLVDSAMASEGDEMIAMLGEATASARRFGNMLEEKQVRRLLEATKGKASDAQATALAALLGALNLPNNSIVPLILNTGGAKN